MNFTEELKYHKEHTWLKVEGSTGTIGITEFAQSELGEIAYVDLPNIGSTYRQGDVFGTAEALKTVSDLIVPISGKIIDINLSLADKPALINNDSFNKGWLIKIEISDHNEIPLSLNAIQYNDLTL